jgi:hypothetical protein
MKKGTVHGKPSRSLFAFSIFNFQFSIFNFSDFFTASERSEGSGREYGATIVCLTHRSPAQMLRYAQHDKLDDKTDGVRT